MRAVVRFAACEDASVPQVSLVTSAKDKSGAPATQRLTPMGINWDSLDRAGGAKLLFGLRDNQAP